MAFAHKFDIDEDTAKKISAGLGGGIGRLREVCGAVSGAAMVIGSLASATEGADVENKQKNFIYYELNTSVVEEVMLWLADLKGGTDNEP